MQRPPCWLMIICASCYAEIGGTPQTVLPRRTFFETCDGSGGVALDADRFFVFAEDAAARVYTRAGDPYPLATVDAPAGIEDAARVGSRIFSIGPQLTSFDVDSLVVNGTSATLLADLVDPTAWLDVNPIILDTLRTAIIHIEGLAFAPTTEYPTRLWVGFQSPLIEGRALAVSLLDPIRLVNGAKAQFGEAVAFDLDGLGIRGMAYSDALGAVLLLAGTEERYRLYRWSGIVADAPSIIVEIEAPVGAVAGAVVTYPQSTDVQIVFDMNDAMVVDNAPCRQVATANRSFQDVVVRVD